MFIVHDDPMVNESEIIFLLRQVWVYVGKIDSFGGELKGRGLCNLQLRIACQSVVTVEGLGLIGGSCSQVYARGKLNHLVATCMRIRFCGYKAYSFPFRLLPFVLGLTGAEILDEMEILPP